MGGEELATLLCRLAARPLIPSAVEDMENIRTSARRAIVGEVFSCGKAFHPSSDVLRGPSCIGMFSEQPETVHYAINQAISSLRTRAPRPINVNVVEVLFRLPRDSIAHRRLVAPASLPARSRRKPAREGMPI